MRTHRGAGHSLANDSLPTSSWSHECGGKPPWETAAKGGKTNGIKVERRVGGVVTEVVLWAAILVLGVETTTTIVLYNGGSHE